MITEKDIERINELYKKSKTPEKSGENRRSFEALILILSGQILKGSWIRLKSKNRMEPLWI